MLESFSKRNKNKKQQKIDELVNKGLILLEKKEYKQATIELTLALEESSGSIIDLLEEKFDVFMMENDYEAIRALGLVISKKKIDDAELFINLGNAARRLKDRKQANHFYRQALKIDNSNITAFHNLAASLANVEIYDVEIQKTLDGIEKTVDFFLPDYKNDVVIDKTADFDQTLEKLKKAIKENWKNRSITEGRTVLQNDIFNLGLFAIHQKQPELALENLTKLKSQKSDIEQLDMLLIIVGLLQGGNFKDAIDKLGLLLQENPADRYLNGNIAVLFKKSGNHLQATKHFLICAVLIKEWDGFFSIDSLIRAAEKAYTDKDFKRALSLFKKAAVETDSLDVWEKLGELYFKLNDLVEAVHSLNTVLRIDPNSSLAKHKLNLIYKQYLEKADALKAEKKYQQAVVVYERALQIERPPELLDSTAKIYKMLRNFPKAEELLEESRQIKEEQRSEGLENERQNFIIKGKEYAKRKEFTAAIENFESAARIRLDKDVFLYLAHIYKGLKRTRALQDLMNRWRLSDEEEAVE